MTDLEPVQLPAVQSVERRAHTLLHAALLDYDDARQALAAQGDIDSLAWGFERLKDLRKSFAALLDAVEQDLVRLMPERMYEVDGLGILERKKGSTNVHWDDKAAVRAVVATAMDEGSALTPDGLADVILRTAGVSYWRVGELKKLGLDAENYRTKEEGRARVIVHGSADL